MYVVKENVGGNAPYGSPTQEELFAFVKQAVRSRHNSFPRGVSSEDSAEEIVTHSMRESCGCGRNHLLN